MGLAQQPGTLDLTFDAKLTNDVAVGSIVARSDGKILVCWNLGKIDAISERFVALLNQDGTMDSAFSGLGHRVWGGGFLSSVSGMAVQKDGRIVIVGQFDNVEGTSQLMIARLLADGRIDASYRPRIEGSGLKGTGYNRIQAITGATNEPTSVVAALLSLSGGKILVGGRFSVAQGAAVGNLVLLNSDGSVDASFLALPGTDGTVFAIDQQTDGKIIIAGDFTKVHGQARRSVARLNSSGTVDNTFDPTSSLSVVNYSSSVVYGLRVLNDGKVLLAGSFSKSVGSYGDVVLRLNADGTPDSSFKPSRLFDWRSRAFSLAVQADGKIVLGGVFDRLEPAPNGAFRRGIIRLETSGSLDTSFGVDPIYGDTGMSPTPWNAVRALVQPDERTILVAGNFQSLDDERRVYLGRVFTRNETPPLLYPIVANGAFTFSIPTLTGTNYVVESKGSLSDRDWQSLPVVKGDGTVQSVNDRSTPGLQRFYRIRIE